MINFYVENVLLLRQQNSDIFFFEKINKEQKSTASIFQITIGENTRKQRSLIVGIVQYKILVAS